MSDTARASSDGGDFEAIREDIDALRKDLACLMEHVKSGAYRNLTGRVEEISGEARRLYDQARTGGERRADALVREVEERPLTSLLVAFTLGFISGKLILR
ncbi:MAG: hypothetical protein ACREFP_01695 [Acetobacteraceae bacterium]